MAKKPRPARPATTTAQQQLRERFCSALQQKGRQARIAGETGVSTKTLGPILRGHLPPSKEPGSDSQIRGLVPALVRLWRYADLDVEPKEILLAYGLPDKETTDAVLSRELRELGLPSVADDPVTQAIRARGTVRLGAIAWAPFLEPSDRAALWRSRAYEFMAAVFGSIYPEYPFQALEFATLNEAMDALIQPRSRADAVFGMYDLPARHAEGIRFIPIPGLFATLGAIVSDGSPQDPSTWFDLSDISPTAAHPTLIVLREEAGHLFVRTAFRTAGELGAEDRLRIVDVPKAQSPQSADAVSLAMRLAAELVVARAADDHVALLVEAETCARVFKVLKDEREEVFRLVQRQNSSVQKNDRLFRFQLLDAHPHFTPRYPISIAIRADASNLHTLIRRAFEIDIYGTVVGRTAGWYYKVLERLDGQRARNRDGTHWFPDLRDPLQKELIKAMLAHPRAEEFKDLLSGHLAPRMQERIQRLRAQTMLAERNDGDSR